MTPTSSSADTPRRHLGVICSIYNDERGVRQLVDRVLEAVRQTGFRYRLILVDDGRGNDGNRE